MIELPFSMEKKKCTGCSACYSVCPVSCIEMKNDKEGFLYPVASDACIHCRKCEKVCPINNFKVNNLDFNQISYAAVTKDENIWKKSSSGGAFSEICNAWGDEKTIVVGAAWDNLKVHHICITGIENITPLYKSKYISSSLEDTFIDIKKKLDNNGKAIFCGTPCQVAGLKAFLGKDNKELFLIDLICHGVGSPAVFQSCINAIGKQFNDEVLSYEFRSKRDIYETDYLGKTNFKNDECKYIINDQYIQLFLKQHCLRSSCGKNCKYRNEYRQGDITIADFKGLNKVFPKLSGTKKNYSSIIINSEKGQSIIPSISQRMELLECDIDDIKTHNPLFYRQTWFSDSREDFFADYISNNNEAIEKWTEPAQEYKKSIKRKIYDILPTSVRRLAINYINRSNNQ